MKKKRIDFAAIILLTLFTAIMFVTACGARPVPGIDAGDVSSVLVTVRPQDRELLVKDSEQIKEIVGIINAVVTYEKSDDRREYAGQYAGLALHMKTGENIEVAAYNPLIIINGQGCKTEYEPCEKLNAIANRLLGI